MKLLWPEKATVFDNFQNITETISRDFNGGRILVVGDLILDRYLWGEVNRISPESPVPVVLLTKEDEVGGGAANVALNLASLGLKVAVAGYVGHDIFRDRLLAILAQKKINTDGIVSRKNVFTITKTRIIGGRQQMLRIDREDVHTAAEASDEDTLLQAVEKHLAGGTDAVILSDYAKGVLTEPLCRKIISAARQHRVPILVDPKGNNFSKYKGATGLSPNRQELATACRTETKPLETLLQAGRKLAAELELDFIAVTLGERGITLLEGKNILHIPAVAKEVFDVSGAGDTVIATLTAGIAAGLNRAESLHLANLAAGIVVGKIGTATVTKNDLLTALSTEQTLEQSEKLCSRENILTKVAQWRAKGDRLVFTNGCFDLLHAGHVTYLAAARRLGNRLIVGVNTDRSVKALKGPDRPVIAEEDRARVLCALSAVDAVVLFDEDTPLELIKAIRPEILAKGNDYTIDQVVGAREMASWNGEVALVPLVDGKSSSNIVQAIQAGRKSR